MIEFLLMDPGLRRELSFALLSLDPAPQARMTNGGKPLYLLSPPCHAIALAAAEGQDDKM
jgi:hypothetical protein